MKLREFKKGDIITRTKRFENVVTFDKFNDMLNVMETVKVRDGRIDNSFIGRPAEFICIQNGAVYYRNIYAPSWIAMGKEEKNPIMTFPIGRYNDDNWAIFEVPEGMTLEEAAKAGW